MAKTLPCPTCSGKALSNEYSKSFLDKVGGFIASPVSKLTKLFPGKSSVDVVSKSSFYNGKCPDCGGSGVIKDYSDTSQQETQAKAKAQALSSAIMAEEAKLNTGGTTNSRHDSILGNYVLEVGIGMNDVQAYATVPKGKPVQSKTNIGQKGVGGGTEMSTLVRGTNPLSTPGGQFILKASNKFTILAGSQGLDFNAGTGPVNIAGGIIKFTGAEVSIGTSVGTTSIEGNHLKLTGQTIELTPSGSTGQVQVNGTLGATGNLVVAGGAHIDGELHFISATAPEADPKPTNLAGLPFNITGSAKWAGEAKSAANKDLQLLTQNFKNDPANFLASPRGHEAVAQRQAHSAYTALPKEIVQTGWCWVPSPVNQWCAMYNFPHNHEMFDGAHQHLTPGLPNIKIRQKDTEIRDQASLLQNGAPAPIVYDNRDVLFSKNLVA